CQVIAERTLEPGLAENSGVQHAGQDGLGAGGHLGGVANPSPDRVDRPGLGGILDQCAVHMALSFDRSGSLVPEQVDRYASRPHSTSTALQDKCPSRGPQRWARASSSLISGSTLPPLFWM